MSPRHVSYGKCFLCGQTFAKNTITRHLKTCLPAHEEAGKPIRLFQLRVEGAYAHDYWMNVEISAGATLFDLDKFLRAVWLECCGHLSAFTIGKVQYELDTGMVDSMWRDIFGSPFPRKSMKVKLYAVLSPGDAFLHEYDFGTTTTLKLKVVGERQGPNPERGVRILARNYAPAYPCVKCGKPAEWLYTYDIPYQPYCSAHARRHKEWEDAFLPLVNSPRTGDCGYTGPTDPALQFEEREPSEGPGAK